MPTTRNQRKTAMVTGFPIMLIFAWTHPEERQSIMMVALESQCSPLSGTEKGTRLASASNVQHQTEIMAEFQKILFDFDQDELKPQYYSVLDEVAVMLSQNPAARVEIQGHTDNVGTASYNQNLSEKRARAVKNYFVRRGVEEDRLFPEGFGFKQNVASNENEAGRALNRRVELAFQD